MPRSLAHLPMTPRNTGSCSAPARWLGSATKPTGSGIRHALILTTPHQRSEGERIGGQLGSRFAAAFANAEMHTPVEVTEAAIQVVEINDIDGLIAVGGGSTVGLGKALSARTGLPQIACRRPMPDPR